jgi:hypothetical protein
MHWLTKISNQAIVGLLVVVCGGVCVLELRGHKPPPVVAPPKDERLVPIPTREPSPPLGCPPGLRVETWPGYVVTTPDWNSGAETFRCGFFVAVPKDYQEMWGKAQQLHIMGELLIQQPDESFVNALQRCDVVELPWDTRHWYALDYEEAQLILGRRRMAGKMKDWFGNPSQ